VRLRKPRPRGKNRGSRLFTSPKLLAVETVIHLSLYLGLVVALVSALWSEGAVVNG
jgi:hypothetical protein